MRKLVFLLVFVVAGCFAYYYFCVGPNGAFRTYQTFMNHVFKLEFDKAEALIGRGAAGSYMFAKRYFQSNYTKFREAPFYPKYVIESEEINRDGKEVKFVIHQTVKANDLESGGGAHLVAFQHTAWMRRKGFEWKVSRFHFAPAPLAQKGIQKKSVTKTGPDGNRVNVWARWMGPVIEWFQMRLGGGASGEGRAGKDPQKKQITTRLPKIPRPGERTFVLKSGQKVVGKVITDDEVYYTVEHADGSQTIVIKEDILS